MARRVHLASVLVLLACHGNHAKPAMIAGRPAPTDAAPVVAPEAPAGSLRLEGQVLGADDAPLAGVTVELSSRPPRSTTSESDGSFAFDELVAGSYTVSAHAGGGGVGRVTVELTLTSDPVILRIR